MDVSIIPSIVRFYFQAFKKLEGDEFLNDNSTFKVVNVLSLFVVVLLATVLDVPFDTILLIIFVLLHQRRLELIEQEDQVSHGNPTGGLRIVTLPSVN